MQSRQKGGARVIEFLGSSRVTSALATTAIAVAILSLPIHNTIGWAGLIAILAALIVLCGASAFARRESLESTGILPLSLIVFVSWAGLSVLWSQYQWATVGGFAYLIAYVALGIYVALVRDMIQIIRSFGDVLRVIMVASLALEVLSGLLIDSPIQFLGIAGNLANGGPISGLVGNRNDLGLLAIIGGVSFSIEWRTKSIPRGLAIFSLILAVLTLGLTRSSVAWGTALVGVAVLAILYGIRRVKPERRRWWQIAVLVAAAIAAVSAWVLRAPIVNALNATGDLNVRLGLWREIWALLKLHTLEGWGWMGQWNVDVPPYTAFTLGNGHVPTSAINAYLDVWFQLGLVGLALFVLLLGLAFVRSWLLASRKRSVIYTWPAVVLATLLTASLAESGVLIEFGLMTFVICCVKASQNLSWRRALTLPTDHETIG